MDYISNKATDCSWKTKQSLAEFIARLAESDDANESLSDLPERDKELVGDFEEEDNEIEFWNHVVTHDATSVNLVFRTSRFLDELDGEAVSEIMPVKLSLKSPTNSSLLPSCSYMMWGMSYVQTIFWKFSKNVPRFKFKKNSHSSVEKILNSIPYSVKCI